MLTGYTVRILAKTSNHRSGQLSSTRTTNIQTVVDFQQLRALCSLKKPELPATARSSNTEKGLGEVVSNADKAVVGLKLHLECKLVL
jgi:hypothetical protein